MLGMKESFIKVFEFLRLAYWVEIATDNPCCTYYFGPFLTYQEAVTAQAGYLEDLENEGAQGLSIEIRRCQPDYNNLTIYDEIEEKTYFPVRPSLSSLSS